MTGNRVLLAYGFRPFFPLAALWLAIAPVPWLLALLGIGPEWPLALPIHQWHGHELLFGGFAAALAGFLLTALPAWTGARPITGRALLALVLLWLAGRIASLSGETVGPPWAMVVDAAFLPVLLVAVVSRRGSHRPPIDLLLAAGLLSLLPLASHLAIAGWLPVSPAAILRLGAGIYLILIGMTLRRILPVVATHAALTAGLRPFRARPGREPLAIWTLILFVAADTFAPLAPATGWLALGAAAAQLERLADWPPPRAWRYGPIALLVLVQVWLVLGLVLRAWCALDGTLPAYTGRHALLVGTMGTAVLAVLGIAGLRHTGRALHVPFPLAATAVLLTIAAALRTAVPLWLPGHYVTLGAGAALLAWGAAWLLWLLHYGPWMARPRVDGYPG